MLNVPSAEFSLQGTRAPDLGLTVPISVIEQVCEHPHDASQFRVSLSDGVGFDEDSELSRARLTIPSDRMTEFIQTGKLQSIFQTLEMLLYLCPEGDTNLQNFEIGTLSQIARQRFLRFGMPLPTDVNRDSEAMDHVNDRMRQAALAIDSSVRTVRPIGIRSFISADEVRFDIPCVQQSSLRTLSSEVLTRNYQKRPAVAQLELDRAYTDAPQLIALIAGVAMSDFRKFTRQ